MLKIKLQRIGKKHQPSYRLVVAEARSKMIAPPVEDLGAYDPFTKKGTLKADRVSHWLKVGAQPTPTAHNLLINQGVVKMAKKVIKVTKKGGEAAPVAAAATPAPGVK